MHTFWYIYRVISVTMHRDQTHAQLSSLVMKKIIRSDQWRFLQILKCRYYYPKGLRMLKVSGNRMFFNITVILQSCCCIIAWIGGLVSVGIISLSGLVGAIFWPLLNDPNRKKTVMRLLLGLATGSLSSSAVFQLLPEVRVLIILY